jgi:SAM-dependent methyltransferase
MTTRYAPEFFNRTTVEEMRGVILSPYGGLSVEERWKVETPWLAERIKFDSIQSDSGVVIDYGCGIGRMSKAIERPCIGVDISLPMLLQAVAYVGRQDFVPVAPMGLRLLVRAGFKARGAMAIWSLQHIPMLADAVECLMEALPEGRPFWLVDLCERAIPVKTGEEFGMADDGRSVMAALEPWCDLESREPLDVWREDPGNKGALYRFRRK